MADLKEVKAPAPKPAQPQSGTMCPYFNLEQSVKVAQVIHERGGGMCSPDQLASFLEYSTVNSGTYLSRISSAKMFGMISSQGDSITITDRARAIISPVMPEDCARAKIDAFLAVGLFKKMYENYKGKTLPPEQGLKNLFENGFKIVKARVAPSVRIFNESAEYAGLFTLGGNTKLIMPTAASAHTHAHTPPENPGEIPPHNPPAPPEKPRFGGGGDGGTPPGIDPALAGLLRKLPAPGAAWSAAEKEGFFAAFKATFDFLYPSEPK